MKILVTGAAGFIGFHLSQKLLARGDTVFGIDNLNNYYDPKLKEARLSILQKIPGFSFQKMDIIDKASIDALFKKEKFDKVVHLAAQAGVRYSLENPHAYTESNITGFINILEACRFNAIQHLVYASSSSVYGANKKLPFSEDDNVDHPVSLYAATKKANELMAHTYSHLFGFPTTGLRFFTVYGPYGRPDMALFLFTKAIIAGQPIKVFNHGKMVRDFTYIDDIIEGVVRTLDKNASPSGLVKAPAMVFNIGNNSPVQLVEFIDAIEEAVGKKAIRELTDIQPGDVPETYADTKNLFNHVGFKPATPIKVGIGNFVKWYRSYFGV